MFNLAKRFYDVSKMPNADLISGDIPSSKTVYRDISKIAMPSVLEMVFMSLIGSMDTMMVGVLGSAAIAAVGLPGQPRMLMLAIFFALNIGVTAVVARRKGEGRREDAKQSFRSALLVSFGLSLIVTAIGVLLAEPLMRLAGGNQSTPYEAQVLKDGTTYFTIMMYALPINAVTMTINAAQRGIGNTKITMYVNIISNVVNVIFNYLLIGGNFGFPKMEVAGAAWASVLGIFIGFLLALYSIISKRTDGFLRISAKDDWRVNKEALKAITKVGSNAMLEQIALRIGFFLYARLIFNLGAESFASHQICMQFMHISFTVGDGIAIAGTSLVGQMLGKKRRDMAMIYGKACQRIALTISICMALAVIPLRYPLVWLFVNANEPHVAELSAQIMIVLACFLPFQTSSVVISGCLRGAGDTKYVAAVMMVCVLLLRPLLTSFSIYVLHFGLVGCWTSSLIDMIIRLTGVYRRFSKGEWTKIKV